MEQALALATMWTVGIVATVVTSWRGAPAAARTEMDALARRVGLPPTAGSDGAMTRFVSRRRGLRIGMALGMIPTAVATSLMPLQEEPGSNGAWWVIAIPIGSTVGAALGTLRATPLAPAGRRSASLTPRRLPDYLSSWERWVTTACLVPMAVALAATAVHLVVGERDSVGWLTLGATVAAVVTWVWTGSLGRRVLDQPAPASGRHELAWHEALRVLALRDVWTVRSTIALFGGAAPATSLVLDRARLTGPDRAVDVVFWLGVALLVSIFALAVALIVAQLVDQRLDWFRGHAGREVLA